MGDSNAVHIYMTLAGSAILLEEVPHDLENALGRAWKRLTPAERREVLSRLWVPLGENAPQKHRKPPRLRVVRGGG